MEEGGKNLKTRHGEERTKGKGKKIGFWNVAGLDSKDTQFWECIKEFDIIGIVETWIEEKR